MWHGAEGFKRSSFLKKRSKKLLLVRLAGRSNLKLAARRKWQKFFGSFFQKNFFLYSKGFAVSPTSICVHRNRRASARSSSGARPASVA
jgi:hypothetical protein